MRSAEFKRATSDVERKSTGDGRTPNGLLWHSICNSQANHVCTSSVIEKHHCRPTSVRLEVTLMTKTTLSGGGCRAITTASPADERHQSDAQAPSVSSLITAASSLARLPYLRSSRSFFDLPWTSANCVIARLHPQLSHLCGEGFQSASDGGPRYIP